MTTNEHYNAQITDNPFISENSKTTYITNMKGILKRYDAKTIHELLHTPERYGPMINQGSEPLNTRYSYFIAILAYIRYSGIKSRDKDIFRGWYVEFEKVREQVKHMEDNNIPSKKQERNMIDWKQVLAVRDRLLYACPEHLLLSIYTYVPPRRQLDYTHMRVYNDAKEVPKLDHNHFHTYSNKYKTAYMFINEFKNAKFFKSFFNKEIPVELVKILKKSLELTPRIYLFVDSDGKAYSTANAFQKYSNGILKRVFDKPEMCVNVLRHSYSTHMSQQYVTVGERQRSAIKMGHSLKKTLEYAFMQKDPPASMLSKGQDEECYKKDKTTQKIVKIPCPSTKIKIKTV